MARIRTVKPEFWTDIKISKISHSCALFFIGLWNFCDDEGKFVFDSKQLSLRMPIFRSKDISGWLKILSDMGLVIVSEGSEWGLVANWNHQKISHPIPPKIKASEIKWVIKHETRNNLDNAGAKSSKDRKGKDSIVVVEDEQQPTKEGLDLKKPNPTSNFDSRFSPEALKLTNFFNEQENLKDLKIFIPQILNRWGSFDLFKLFFDGVFSAKGFKTIDPADIASRKKYFMAAFEDEIQKAKEVCL